LYPRGGGDTIIWLLNTISLRNITIVLDKTGVYYSGCECMVFYSDMSHAETMNILFLGVWYKLNQGTVTNGSGEMLFRQSLHN
jgi:hypothetical protein